MAYDSDVPRLHVRLRAGLRLSRRCAGGAHDLAASGAQAAASAGRGADRRRTLRSCDVRDADRLVCHRPDAGASLRIGAQGRLSDPGRRQPAVRPDRCGDLSGSGAAGGKRRDRCPQACCMMAAASETIVRVLSAGPGTTLQDAGRHGYLRFGVTAAGPMDSLAHATANLAVGNPEGSTALEVSLGGIEVTAESGPLSVAVAGGDFMLSLDGRSLPPAVVLNLDDGAVLKIRAACSGSWCYLAVAGRLIVPKVLDSH